MGRRLDSCCRDMNNEDTGWKGKSLTIILMYVCTPWPLDYTGGTDKSSRKADMGTTAVMSAQDTSVQ